MAWRELTTPKKAGFIILLILALVFFILTIKFGYDKNFGVTIFVFILFVACFAGSMVLYFSKQTCNPEKWKSRKNVILPTDIGQPYSSNVTSLCDAQKIAEYDKNATSFYYGNSKLWLVLTTYEPKVTSSENNTDYTFYYMDELSRPNFTNQNCRNVQFSNTQVTEAFFVKNVDSTSNIQTISNFFVNRAGTGLYIGDFTIQYSDGKTALMYSPGVLTSPSPTQIPLDTKNVPSFNWSTCAPDFVQKFVPKMIKENVTPLQEKIIKIDTSLMKAAIDHFTNNDITEYDFWTVPYGPWKKTMQIKGRNMFHKDAVVRYDGNMYTGTYEITNTLRNLLIRE